MELSIEPFATKLGLLAPAAATVLHELDQVSTGRAAPTIRR